jgi:hypothetical protein
VGLKGRGAAAQQANEEAMNTLTTSFVKRLRDRDETAWFE